MSKMTFHEVQGTIVKITDNRVKNLFWKEGDDLRNKTYGNVSVLMITPAVDDEQHYRPAQETFFFAAGVKEIIDLLSAAIAEPSSSVTEPNAK